MVLVCYQCAGGVVNLNLKTLSFYYAAVETDTEFSIII